MKEVKRYLQELFAVHFNLSTWKFNGTKLFHSYFFNIQGYLSFCRIRFLMASNVMFKLMDVIIVFIINLLLGLACGKHHTMLYHQIHWMCFCSLKMKNMSAKFGSPGKRPWISPASVAGSVWKTAVFHRGDIPWYCEQRFAPDGGISAWHCSPHFRQGHDAASEL